VTPANTWKWRPTSSRVGGRPARAPGRRASLRAAPDQEIRGDRRQTSATACGRRLARARRARASRGRCRPRVVPANRCSRPSVGQCEVPRATVVPSASTVTRSQNRAARVRACINAGPQGRGTWPAARPRLATRPRASFGGADDRIEDRRPARSGCPKKWPGGAG
jgi:hypothetical protein